jgi:hypothetical protein
MIPVITAAALAFFFINSSFYFSSWFHKIIIRVNVMANNMASI